MEAYQARNQVMQRWAEQQRVAAPERAPFPAFVDFDAMSRDPLAPDLLAGLLCPLHSGSKSQRCPHSAGRARELLRGGDLVHHDAQCSLISCRGGGGSQSVIQALLGSCTQRLVQ